MYFFLTFFINIFEKNHFTSTSVEQNHGSMQKIDYIFLFLIILNLIFGLLLWLSVSRRLEMVMLLRMEILMFLPVEMVIFLKQTSVPPNHVLTRERVWTFHQTIMFASVPWLTLVEDANKVSTDKLGLSTVKTLCDSVFSLWM